MTYDPTHTSSLGPATHAVIWGRNDAGGRAWAETAADAVGIPCVVVALKNLPPHWHFDAGLPPGRTAAQLTAYLKAAVGRCALRQPPAPPTPLPATPALPANLTLPPNLNISFIRNGARNDGSVKPIMRNAQLLLEANTHIWDLRHNDFANRATLGGQYLTDQDSLKIAGWVQEHGVTASTATITEAILAVAAVRHFHPLREYLDGLTWDGIQRLEDLFVEHAGSPDTELVRAFSAKWFIQAVARVYEPGCQADGTLVLESAQGMKKSTFFRELFGDMWFTDHLPDITSKDALIQLRGVWCVEIAELATFGRAEAARIKQFLTSRVDRYRDPFGRMVSDFPRTCVFAGSINPGAGGYLKDETGARRFWPMPVGERIDIPAVSSKRDLLWAEAVARYRAREPWYLNTDSLNDAAADAASDRFASDPWQEKIEDFIALVDEVTIQQIFVKALNVVDQAKWTQADMNRISRCLAFAKWVRIKKGPGRWAYRRGDGAAPRRGDSPWDDDPALV